VRDLDRARSFYAQILGLPIVMEYPRFVAFDLGTIWLGLHPSEVAGEDIGSGPLLNLQVSNLRSTLDYLQGQGVMTHRDIQAVPGGQIATVLDTEGNALGLYEGS
jgi:predicted enzyme related to lactoylglutathione lyase